MCGGFTFKGVQLQDDTMHEVTLMMLVLYADNDDGGTSKWEVLESHKS